MSVNARGQGFEVYVKRNDKRYRVTAKTLEQGKAMEADILASLAAGREPDLESIKAVSVTGQKTLRDAAALAKSRVWKGLSYEATACLNIDDVVSIIGPEIGIADLDDEDIDRLVLALETRGLSDATINRKVSTLRVALTLSVKRGWRPAMLEIEHRKEAKGRVRWFNDAEEKQLLGATRHLGLEDLADLWTFLIDTGARIGEALKLTWRDVSATHATFWVTKNGDPRTVPLTERVKRMLGEQRVLLNQRPEQEHVFHMSYPEARRHWDRIKHLTGNSDDDQWVIHTLRHTCASRLVQRGVPLLVVMKWLGHKSISMTMRYSHLAPSNLDDAVSVLNAPVAELADAPDLKLGALGHGGSSPSGRTKLRIV